MAFACTSRKPPMFICMLVRLNSIFGAQTFPLSFRNLYQLNIFIWLSHRHVTNNLSKCNASYSPWILVLPSFIISGNGSTVHPVYTKTWPSSLSPYRAPPSCAVPQQASALFWQTLPWIDPTSFTPHCPYGSPSSLQNFISTSRHLLPKWPSHNIQIMFLKQKLQ